MVEHDQIRPRTILPEGWYEEREVRMMGFPESSLQQARDSGELKAKQLKGVTWYKGEWLLAWLEGPEVATK